MSVPQGRRAVLAGMLALTGAALAASAPLPAVPWPGAVVVRGQGSVVVGDRAVAGLLADLAARADCARRRIAAIWGPVRPVVLFPETDAQAAVLAGAAGVAATRGLAALATADRVVVLPGGYARLSEVGRDVVLTHELVHVATGATRGGRVPMWLSEGFADYVGYAGTGLDVRRVAAELAREVRAGVLPDRLPGPGDFAPGGARLPQVYEEAWLACRYVAARFGERALVRLYGSDVGTTLGLTAAEFTAGWRDHLRKELA
ncbi:lipoprotein [Planomonospora sphaerica]|uniref:Lipoprotein n=1 Tax=Planomonospora sphaerica TaxID=161355 RepID=A0A171BDF0_9ACTN|nr:hypothetical protein [Planomonospora sphaerica]GAT64942.1 lipoprotein [Planomonospora sphaerica]